MMRVLIVLVVFAAYAQELASRTAEPFADLRQRMRESCTKRKSWKAPLRIKGLPLEVGTLFWGCPASFRLEYRGPGAFEYASNGVEAWIARPSFVANNPEIEHHWKLGGTDLDLALAYLRGDESKLPLLKRGFKAETGTAPGLWTLTITPFKADEFSSLRLEWKLVVGSLSGVQWTSPEGLPLHFDIGPPEVSTLGSVSAAVVPKIPRGARVTKIPALIKKKN